jgi:hypothetical protein
MHGDLDCAPVGHVIDSLLVLGFQQAHNSSSSSGCGSSSSSMLAAPRQHRQPLALRSFSSSFLHSARLLSALPSAALTHLQLQSYSAAQPARWALSSISGLTLLKCLALEGNVSCSCLPLLQPLKQLTSLDIATLDAEAGILQDLQGFPASLVRLQLSEFRLLVSSVGQVAAECFLDLQPLIQLTRLSYLELTSSFADAAAMAGAWADLPQLRSLAMWPTIDEQVPEGACRSCLRGLGKCTACSS